MSSNSRLQGKIALVTGGTTGIGLASAKLFAEEGATVIVTGRNPETLEAARKELGNRAEVIKSDASDPEDVRALFEHVSANHGRLDVLFLNAGIAQFFPIEAVNDANFDKIFHVNVLGPILAIKHATPVLNEGAAVLLNTSVVNVKGMPGAAVYAASKAALRSVARTAAAELAPKKVRVNAVAPGPIETPIYGKLDMPKEQVDGFAESVVAQVPLARFGSSQEVANAALFLVSPESSYVNGAELSVDGGMTQL